MTRLLPLLALLALLPLGGCKERPGPDVAWKRFAEASRKGDANTAWSLLSTETQAGLTRAAQAVAQAEGRDSPKDGRALLVSQSSRLVAPPKTVQATFEGKEAATVLVVDEAGERGSVRAVFEEGRWRFDLQHELDL